MFQLDVLVETSFRPIALGAVVNRAFVVPSDLSRSPPVTLLLLVVDFERHVQHFFVLALVGLGIVNVLLTYLEPVKLITEILLLI